MEYKKIITEATACDLQTIQYLVEVEALRRAQELILEKEPQTLELKLLNPIKDVKRSIETLLDEGKEYEDVCITKIFLRDHSFFPESHHNYSVNGVREVGGKKEKFYIGSSDYSSTLLSILQQFEDAKVQEENEKRAMRKIHFDDEDIIITDPCYIIKKGEESNDWVECEYGQNMEKFGITNYIIRNTIYGDWSCTTFNKDTNEEIGNFCADAGMVGVFSLKEVLTYNPNFNYHEEKPWTTTLIKNFSGDVWFEKKNDGKYEYIEVVGEGSVNFIGKQTGC